MRICLIADLSGRPDEGMKNISKQVYKGLSKRHDILSIKPKALLKENFLKRIRSFKPEITHYLHGPTIRSFITLIFLKFLTGNKSKTISSATKPYFGKISKRFLPLLRTNLILTQSEIWEDFFKSYGFNVSFFPNGIDIDKFCPTTYEEKMSIRDEFGFHNNIFIVLHVGHIRKNRNLLIFRKIQKLDGIQVVIVGGTTNPLDTALRDELLEAGCKVYHQYIDDISIFYKMADIYVFPLRYSHNELPNSYNEVGAIDLPLSILEAMACNIPVITTPFGALPRIFIERKGFHYFNNYFELIAKLDKAKKEENVETRLMVKKYDWNSIIDKLEKVYEEILS